MSLELNVEKCMRCGACVGACPVNAIFLKEHSPAVGRGCTECGLCVNICPVGAFSLGGE